MVAKRQSPLDRLAGILSPASNPDPETKFISQPAKSGRHKGLVRIFLEDSTGERSDFGYFAADLAHELHGRFVRGSSNHSISQLEAVKQPRQITSSPQAARARRV